MLEAGDMLLGTVSHPGMRVCLQPREKPVNAQTIIMPQGKTGSMLSSDASQRHPFQR